MKHLFYLQSNITYSITLSIIKKLKLKPSEVLLIVRNHYNTRAFEYDIYDFEIDFKDLFQPKNFFQRLFSEDSQFEKFDKKLTKITENQPFIIYLPNIYSSERQVFINHKNCVQVNFIEEGLMAYKFTNTYKLDFYGNLKGRERLFSFGSRILFYFGRRRQFKPKHYFDLQPVNKKNKSIFYGVTKESFKFYNPSKLEIVPLEATNNKISLPKESHLIVLESLPENNLVSKERFYKAVGVILNDIKSERIFLKFHPLQSPETIANISELIASKNKIVNILERNTMIEDLLINSKSLHVYGFLSSLLFYGKILGHNVKSYCAKLESDELFQNGIKKNNINLKELFPPI